MSKHTPSELPLKPEGWTKRLGMHMNFGEDGGAACYTVHDAEGRETGIAYQYDTRKHKPATEAVGKRKAKPGFEPAATGFHFPAADSDVYRTWAELRAAWPAILDKLKAKNESAS